MGNIARTIMCILLPLTFIFIGLIKLYPVFPGVYKEMQKKFGIYNQVFITAWFGYPPDPDLFRIFVGSMEMSCGLGVMLGPTGLKKVGCCILIVLMTGASLTHLLSGEIFEVLIPIVYISWTAYVLYVTMQAEARSLFKSKTE